MLPAILHATAFLISLFVQTWASPLAGAWVFFQIAGCVALLYAGNHPKNNGVLWYVCLAWLMTLGISAFLFAPVKGGASTLAVLAAMPSLALCVRKEHLEGYLTTFLAILTIYAAGVVVQLAFGLHTTAFNYEGRHSWPLVDPNNGAAVISMGLLAFAYMALFKSPMWTLPCILFAVALYATGSKAGVIGAACGLAILLSVKCEIETVIAAVILLAINAVMVFLYRPELIVNLVNSFRDRFPIWDAAWQLVFIRPLLGLGMGTFGFYYDQIRTEHYTEGWHSHNDLLQIAVEAGIPAALMFIFLVITVMFTTCRANLASAVVLLAGFLEAMVEFQLYIPAISIPMGLALAYHIVNRPENKRI